jgi:hypothetical protein
MASYGKEKRPYRSTLKDERIFFMAGQWKTWNSPEGEKICFSLFHLILIGYYIFYKKHAEPAQ